MKTEYATIYAYNAAQSQSDKEICLLLKSEFERALKNSESKIWHGAPVWFLEGNPIVGYSKQKAGLRMMFWSGADFAEDTLNIRSVKFKDASLFYTSVDEVNVKDLRRWLEKSITIQWDYKNIVKKKGKLEKIK